MIVSAPEGTLVERAGELAALAQALAGVAANGRGRLAIVSGEAGIGKTALIREARLHLSPRTVDHHVTGILQKLAVRNRIQAVRAAERLGLLDPDER